MSVIIYSRCINNFCIFLQREIFLENRKKKKYVVITQAFSNSRSLFSLQHLEEIAVNKKYFMHVSKLRVVTVLRADKKFFILLVPI